MTVIPVIDLERITLTGPGAADTADLLHAAQTSGFFLVRNHGIDRALIHDYDRLIDEAVFNRPAAEKSLLASPTGHPERGWRAWPDEQGRLEMQRYLIGRFDNEAQAAAAGVRPEDLVVYEHENVWPQDHPEFEPAAKTFFAETRRLAARLLAVLAEALKLPANAFLPPGPDSSHLGANVYANWPYKQDGSDPKVYVGDHADGGALTVLHRGGDHLGLEVKIDDRWVVVPLVEDTITINVAELGEVWTNGRLHAARHRVTAGNGRTSTAVFFQPSLETVVTPLLPPLPGRDAYEPVSVAEKEKTAVERYLKAWGRPAQVTAWATRSRYVADVVT